MGRAGSRRRIDRSIYEDGTGRAVIVEVRGVRQERRFPPETDLETLQRNRDEMQLDLRDARPAVPRGTLAHDVERYLEQIAGRPGFKADRSHLRAWMDRLGSKSRSHITAGDVRAALAAWRQTGTWAGGRGSRDRHALTAAASEKTLRERWRVLKHLYKTLDGPRAKTPCDDVPRPKPPAPTPVAVTPAIVQRVTERLHARAHPTPLRSRERQEYARFLMLVTTGQRPAQLKRAIAEDFRLDEEFWVVRGAKGGPTHSVHLNEEMRAAVKVFLGAGAVGAYDDQQLLDLARAHGWPKTIPLYNARHSLAFDAILKGADLGDLQAMLGHASIETTRRFYGPILQGRQKAFGQRLQGRLTIPADAETPVAPSVAPAVDGTPDRRPRLRKRP